MLTKRELEVLKLCAEGYSNVEIAEILIISRHTVKIHIEKILFKLNAPNRTCAAIKGVRLGLIK